MHLCDSLERWKEKSSNFSFCRETLLRSLLPAPASVSLSALKKCKIQIYCREHYAKEEKSFDVSQLRLIKIFNNFSSSPARELHCELFTKAARKSINSKNARPDKHRTCSETFSSLSTAACLQSFHCMIAINMGTAISMHQFNLGIGYKRYVNCTF